MPPYFAIAVSFVKDKGVLGCRREGSKVFYRIENENVIRLLGCVNQHCDRSPLSNNS